MFIKLDIQKFKLVIKFVANFIYKFFAIKAEKLENQIIKFTIN